MVVEDQVRQTAALVCELKRYQLVCSQGRCALQVSRRSTSSSDANVDVDASDLRLGTDPEERLLQERDVEEGIAPHHEVGFMGECVCSKSLYSMFSH